VRDILWGASEVNAHPDKNHPRRAEILNLYEDTTYLAKGIIANDDEIVRPLKLQRSAKSLKCVNESKPDDEGVSAQGRERLRGLKEKGRHHGAIGRAPLPSLSSPSGALRECAHNSRSIFESGNKVASDIHRRGNFIVDTREGESWD
jgi:hypothetical protein